MTAVKVMVAPSADALPPAVPAAPVVEPTRIAAFGSPVFNVIGVSAPSVGNAEPRCTVLTRCCAEVALADCPIHQRNTSRFKLGPAAARRNSSVAEPLATVTPPVEIQNSRMVVL